MRDSSFTVYTSNQKLDSLNVSPKQPDLRTKHSYQTAQRVVKLLDRDVVQTIPYSTKYSDLHKSCWDVTSNREIRFSI